MLHQDFWIVLLYIKWIFNHILNFDLASTLRRKNARRYSVLNGEQEVLMHVVLGSIITLKIESMSDNFFYFSGTEFRSKHGQGIPKRKYEYLYINEFLRHINQ